jgi:hypothetical protein
MRRPRGSAPSFGGGGPGVAVRWGARAYGADGSDRARGNGGRVVGQAPWCLLEPGWLVRASGPCAGDPAAVGACARGVPAGRARCTASRRQPRWAEACAGGLPLALQAATVLERSSAGRPSWAVRAPVPTRTLQNRCGECTPAISLYWYAMNPKNQLTEMVRVAAGI